MVLWDRTFDAVAAEFPDVTTESLLVDAAAMNFIRRPESFDVVRYSGSLEYMSEIVNTRGELVPHLGLDVATIEDPFIRRLSELQLGADVFRFDASDLVALKAEYQGQRSDGARANAGFAQVAFSF